MPVRLSINEIGFNVQLSIAEWNDGLVVYKCSFGDECIIPAPAHLSLSYLRLLPDGQCWYNSIPSHSIKIVSRFPDHKLRLLSLMAQSAACQQIMNSPYRLTLYLAVHYFLFDDKKIIDAAENGVVELLNCMHLSSTSDALEFITRVDISYSLRIADIHILLSEQHKQYQGFANYQLITKTVLQLNSRYPKITNTALAVWLTELCKHELPIYITNLLDDIDSLVKQKAIPGGWRRFLSLTSINEIEKKLVRYQTLQRYSNVVRACAEKKKKSEHHDELPEFDSLVVIEKPRMLLRYCLFLQQPKLEPECWDLFVAALNNEAVIYLLPKPNSGVLALQIFRDSDRNIKGLRFLCAKPKYQDKLPLSMLNDIFDGLNKYQKKYNIKIDYEHAWF